MVIQADWFDALSTIVVLPLTSTLIDAAVTRIDVKPSAGNGLRLLSQIAIDRPHAVSRAKLGPAIGRLDNDVMLEVQRALAVLFRLA